MFLLNLSASYLPRKGLFIWARLTGLARLPRSRLTPISFVKISMCSYEKAGQPGYRDLGCSTGGPSSSCEMSILRNNSHGGIIRVCMGIFTTALRNKKYVKFSKKKTSPYFHSVSLVIWPLTLMKRAHLSELFISRFSTYIRKAQGWTLHFRTPDPRSENSKLKMTGRPQIQRRIQAHIL